MFSYRLNQFLALAASLFALIELVNSHSNLSAHIRLTLLLYSSLLIVTVSTFAMRNLVGQPRYTRFGHLLLVTSQGIYLLFLCSNALLVGIGWTVSGAGALLLVNHANNRKSRRAMREIGVWFLVSDLAFWAALLLAHNHHINLFAANTGSHVHGSTLYYSIALLITVSGVIRSGAFPAMRWLILTSEAPSPLSAFLHAGIVNGFGYLLIVFPIIHRTRIIIVVISMITIILALSIMRHRHDEKGKLANGTSMQMAFMALEGVLGIPGIILLHIVGHGSYKSWSFLRAGGAPLRKKNAMPLPQKGVDGTWAIVLLTSLYISIVGIAIILLGRDYLLNISVLSVALASSLIFSSKLPKSLRVQSTIFSMFLFFIYVLIVWSASELFPKSGDSSVTLVLTLSILIISVTLILRITPRKWTLRVASRANKYSLSQRDLREGLQRLQTASSRSFEQERTHQLVEVTTSPFAEGMALSRIVAQDSLVGLNHLDYGDAAKIAQRYGISLYSSATQYLSWLDQGIICPTALSEHLKEYSLELTFEELMANTQTQAQLEILASKNKGVRLATVADRLAASANWWSAQSWSNAKLDQSIGAYQLWRETLPAKHRELLPQKPIAALAQILPLLVSRSNKGVEAPNDDVIALLQRLISLDISWLLYAKGLGSDAEESLLALRAALLLFTRGELEDIQVNTIPHAHLWQSALEQSFSDNLKSEITPVDSMRKSGRKFDVSVVTCIDVRSDVLRMKAEEVARVRTVGMAGFFGLDLCVSNFGNGGGENFAPIILTPSLEIVDERKARFIWSLPALWKYASSGSGALAIAEGFGLLNGVLSATNTFAPKFSRKLNRLFEPDRWLDGTGSDISILTNAQKLEYASNILAIVFPLDSEITEEVVFVGHGAEASNTPFRSMYECGACGGNNGSLNARFATSLMNDALVQSTLSSKYLGRTIRFYAAEHNTTAATFTIDPLQMKEVATQSSAILQNLVNNISTLPRREFPTSSNLVSADVSTASAWWQVFPEWGLSANAACIIGPRELTRNINLRSRVFLHDYCWENDPGGEILKTIFSGPGIVMQMINSAYNAAITSPKNFSSGDKTRHNVLGEAGVLLGAEGPLLRGMPWQAISPYPDLSKGESRGHIPIRLQIFVAAPDSIISRALYGTALAPLVLGGWVSLHSLNTEIASIRKGAYSEQDLTTEA
jgi:NADH:ubiquinone oxidoreductase subunit 5 (subunit L)/multisubunit Na+/H+ antiporter MnhA subunit